MNPHQIDLSLLQAFHAMMEHQHVTRAGRAIGLSQPAMSAALAKLRALLDDPLFVRTAVGMQPTPCASRLAPAIAQVIHIIHTDILAESSFDPATSGRQITINTPDIGEAVFMPRLLARLASLAPNLRVKSVNLLPEQAEQALEAGEVDLSLGYYPDLKKAGFYQQRLFRHSFVCIARKRHPHIRRGQLDLDTYLALPHAVVHTQGRHQELLEGLLLERGIQRRITFETPHFMSLPMVIAESDLIATVPYRLGKLFAQPWGLQLLPLPVAVPDYDLRQYWHSRFHRDAASVWLRKVVYELFGEAPQAMASEP